LFRRSTVCGAGVQHAQRVDIYVRGWRTFVATTLGTGETTGTFENSAVFAPRFSQIMPQVEGLTQQKPGQQEQVVLAGVTGQEILETGVFADSGLRAKFHLV
jgi:hypothetical protein